CRPTRGCRNQSGEQHKYGLSHQGVDNATINWSQLEEQPHHTRDGTQRNGHKNDPAVIHTELGYRYGGPRDGDRKKPTDRCVGELSAEKPCQGYPEGYSSTGSGNLTANTGQLVPSGFVSQRA